jgi:pimeloyl-ACP methyl ester carboxylesterase
VQDVGTGPAVVLVAGFGLDPAAWNRQVRTRSRRHRVICIDQRGHGYSDESLAGAHEVVSGWPMTSASLVHERYHGLRGSGDER